MCLLANGFVLSLFTCLYSRQCSLGAESAEVGTVRAVQSSVDVFMFIDSKFSLLLSVIESSSAKMTE